MNAVGEKNFMSEEDMMFYSGTIDSNIHRASLMTTGGFICGEAKLAYSQNASWWVLPRCLAHIIAMK